MTDKQLVIVNGYAFCSERVDGITRNAREILRCIDAMLPDMSPGYRFEIAVPEANECVPAYRNIFVRNLSEPRSSIVAKARWRNQTFPQYVDCMGALGLDMVLGMPPRGKMCVFDYDCIPEKLPDSCFNKFAKARVWHYMRRMKKSLNNAELVFTDSEYAKSEILSYYPISSEKIIVIPCAWQHMLRVAQDDGIVDRLGLEDGRFFFSLGSRFPYKNVHWVSCAARQNPQYQFVVTGSEVRVNDRENEGAPSNLIFTGYLSDEEVKGLEAHCRAFLHPSLAEGFGIPPMEAMSAGAHCIVAKAASLPEVYGDSVWYIDPTDYDHIDLDEIMSTPLAGTNEDVLERYSWEKSARMLLEALSGIGDRS